jgi:hypothetical protein
MKNIKKFNERREEEEEESYDSFKGPDKQDVSHWEIVRKHGKSYLKISTDDDVYFTEVKSESALNSLYDDLYDDN